jgi:hypothetical protein
MTQFHIFPVLCQEFSDGSSLFVHGEEVLTDVLHKINIYTMLAHEFQLHMTHVPLHK